MEPIENIQRFAFPTRIFIYGENVLARLNTRDSVSQDFIGRRSNSWTENLAAGIFGFQPSDYSYVIRRNRRIFQLRGPKVIEVCSNGVIWGGYLPFDEAYGKVNVLDTSLRKSVESLVEELNRLGGVNFKVAYQE